MDKSRDRRHAGASGTMQQPGLGLRGGGWFFEEILRNFRNTVSNGPVRQALREGIRALGVNARLRGCALCVHTHTCSSTWGWAGVRAVREVPWGLGSAPETPKNRVPVVAFARQVSGYQFTKSSDRRRSLTTGAKLQLSEQLRSDYSLRCSGLCPIGRRI